MCGSFRRGAASSGDIDILIGHPDYSSDVKKKPDLVKRVVKVMEEAGFVTDTLSLGETKFMVSCIYTKETEKMFKINNGVGNLTMWCKYFLIL